MGSSAGVLTGIIITGTGARGGKAEGDTASRGGPKQYPWRQ